MRDSRSDLRWLVPKGTKALALSQIEAENKAVTGYSAYFQRRAGEKESFFSPFTF